MSGTYNQASQMRENGYIWDAGNGKTFILTVEEVSRLYPKP